MSGFGALGSVSFAGGVARDFGFGTAAGTVAGAPQNSVDMSASGKGMFNAMGQFTVWRNSVRMPTPIEKIN